MTIPKSGARGKGKGKAAATSTVVPNPFQELLAENRDALFDAPERPLKRRKTGRRQASSPESVPKNSAVHATGELGDPDDEDLEFEDVLGPDRERSGSLKRLQTAYRDSGEESESSGSDWDPLDYDAMARDGEEPSGDLELTLTKKIIPKAMAPPRRKGLTKDERAVRLQVHKMHVLCLLAYLERRNAWCNDAEVQKALKPLLSKKIRKFLNPGSDLSQFGQTNSLTRGLADAINVWIEKFNVTERGMRRSLWAEKEAHLQDYQLRPDSDTCIDKSDFRAAAISLKGSRDVGVQLFCAMLRSVGVETRLICSLQPLSFVTGGPSMSRPPAPKLPMIPQRTNTGTGLNNPQSPSSPLPRIAGSSTTLPVISPRRRLGHPNAADYNLPNIAAPTRVLEPKVKKIAESDYPIFWVEVFDHAHQKWVPVDPMVSHSVAKPRGFEPPSSDKENNMSYVIAFEEDGCARDVTRRYSKAYNAKTRKTRVEYTHGGEKWWRKTMRAFSRGWKSDVDQIEDSELAALEASEPMPKNVIDFKDHPYYALERHLKKNEILVEGAKKVGTVAAGRDPAKPGLKKLENIYRRQNVKSVKSSGAWYRLGRDTKMGEQPAKVVAARQLPQDDDMNDGGDPEESAGTNLYTEDQTEPCYVPPVVNGQVPKNSYGNLDIYVPSMVPAGGVHIPDSEASRAARLLSIDYADALVGFDFRGRQGTAVLKGAVVAIEYQEAVEAVIEGFRDERLRAEEDMRTNNALRMWKRFMLGLRVKQRVDAYEIEGEDEPKETEEDLKIAEDSQEDDGMGMESEEYEDDGGGGFMIE